MNKFFLKGIPASPGKVRGQVKIITSKTNSNNFELGNILVTKLTDPTMVMMMARAKAIVCDLGGITSHPAIVSREMGIPCIVNTQKATQVLKNGDLVEVDGNLGLITKLYE